VAAAARTCDERKAVVHSNQEVGVKRFVLPVVAVALFAPAVFADDAKASAPKAKPAASLVMVPADQLKWVANPGGPDMSAVVWGDATKGPHGAFHKFPAGFTAPLHTHTADLRIVVISGTLIEGTEAGVETKLPSGSYVYQPHGVKHTTKCDAASECIIFVVASGKFDITMVDGKKAAAK
jgi:beta-alanine degradation protein BauB